MSLSLSETKRLAELARLELDESELAQCRQELDRILGYVDRLSKVDTQYAQETETTGEVVAFRPDVAFPCDDATRELILTNFPDHAGSALRVPAVFEKPKG